MVDEVILKKQVTSYFLEKNITAITKVITDVWRKGWARSLGALGLGLGDPLASLDIVGWYSCFRSLNNSYLAVLKPGETSRHCLGETDGRVTVAGGGVMWFPPGSRQTQHLHARDVWLAICLRGHPPLSKARRTTRLSPCTLWFSCCKQWSLQAVAGQSRDWQKF